MLEPTYKQVGTFKYSKVFQCDNGSVSKIDVKKLFERHNVGFWRAVTKYNQTHKAFVAEFKKDFEKQWFRPMDVQELQKLE